jgi:hypothetical protein
MPSKCSLRIPNPTQVAILSCLMAVIVGSSAAAATNTPSFSDRFIDPEDGMLDMTDWLGEAYGFLPVPVIITEPAVGYGAGLMVAFFHDSIKNRAADAAERELPRLIPPSITAGGGFYTENGSAAGGIFHRGVWSDNRLIYRGGLFGSAFKLKYFTEYDGSERAFSYDIDGYGTLQELLIRLGESDLLIGPRYTLISTTTTFSEALLPPTVGDDKLNINDGALGLALRYDSLDNPFTPNKGVLVLGEVMGHDEALGGDLSYEQAALDLQAFVPVRGNLIAAARCKLNGVTDEAPFYALPYVELRGIPAQRYAGDVALTLAVDLRWDFTARWSLVGFGGGGRAVDSFDDLSGATVHYAGGTGFRYLIARGFRLRTGLDIAVSEDDIAIYITMGNGW